MNRVTLTKDEAGWFSRNVAKMVQLLEERGKKEPEILKRTTYKTLKSMLKEAVSVKDLLIQLKDEPAELDVNLNREQKLVLRQLMESVNSKLKDITIPEYKRRGKSHSQYLANAEIKSGMLNMMMRKFK